MFYEQNGPDFLRVQRSGTARISDPLDPEVIFSGAFDDGQVLFFSQAVSAPGNGTVNFLLNFGRTLANPPVVYGGVKLSQAVTQDGRTMFNAGEIIPPCTYQYTRSGTGRVINFGFTFLVTPSSISGTVNGFVGTAAFLVLDVV